MTFALIASVLNLIGYIWYDCNLLRGITKPNLSSWLIWVVITFITVSSYVVGTGDIIKSALSISVFAANIVTIILILRLAKFSRPAKLDITAIIIGGISILVWIFTRSALFGNAIIQIAIVAGGIPTYRSVWLDPRNEKPWPWLIWSATEALAVIVVVMRWVGQPLELLYPAVGVLLYGGIGLLALRKNSRQAVLPLN